MMRRATAVFSSLVCAVLSVLVLAAPAAAQESLLSDWKFRAVVYGWFPTVSGSSSYPAGSGSSVDLDAQDYLSNLRFVFMGSLEARKDRWGLLTDYIYLNFDAEKGGSRDLTLTGPLGRIELPVGASAGVDLGLRGWAWTLVGTYALVEKPEYEMGLVGGTRLLKIDNTIDWRLTGNVGSLPPVLLSGSSTIKPSVWDAIVGARGRVKFGDGNRWFVPYYVDIGTGQSDLTWQAMGGIGYTFTWGEVFAAYRHLDYKFGSSDRMKDLSFSGPGIAFGFRW